MTILTGGCQCGQVRYVADVIPKTAHLCHCRMCQKAAGNYFMPLANAPKVTFEAMGEISWFQSSDPVRRGFCAKCGTPLIFETIDAAHLNVTLGSLDTPAAIMPVEQSGTEARMPWFDQLPNLRGEVSGASETDGGARLRLIGRTCRQHPDHE
jgi:hypothetical protein